MRDVGKQNTSLSRPSARTERVSLARQILMLLPLAVHKLLCVLGLWSFVEESNLRQNTVNISVEPYLAEGLRDLSQKG